MSSPAKLEMHLEEEFEHLPRAPIVEAVLSFVARAQTPWDEASITPQIKHELPDYPKLVSRQHVQQEITLSNLAPDQPQSILKNLGWLGLILQSADDKQIARLNRDAFSFHRLQPYEGWDKFSTEAVRLWRVHAAIARPLEIQRAGLRFINRIEMDPSDARCEEYIRLSPQPIHGLELPFLGFFHQDTFSVPGHPFMVNVIRTVQPPASPDAGPAIILDIEVSTGVPMPLDLAQLAPRLRQMRWLKNKVFFGNITEKALNKFK